MDRRTTLIPSCVVALALIASACTSSKTPASPTPPSSSTTPPADGSTLKVTAPAPQSPVNDQLFPTTSTVTLTTGAAASTFSASVALTYRFQVFNAASTMVQENAGVGTTQVVTATLAGGTRYTWRVRAESGSSVGPWSSSASFTTVALPPPVVAIINDPLTNGSTVASLRFGGQFVAGQGWQSNTYTDSLDYILPSPCSDCTAEFDVTGTGGGLGNPADLKWFTMGDSGSFGDFSAFRDHPWKMHLEQRGDGDGTGMKLIWRNGGAGTGDPGDHTDIQPPNKAGGPSWKGQKVHFIFKWTPKSYSIQLDSKIWFSGFFDGGAFAPPSHDIELGCRPRGESQIGVIYSNFILKKN